MKAVFHRCLTMLGRAEEADDAVQEVVFKALRSHAGYDPDLPFRPWLMGIASNHCRDRRREAWIRRVMVVEDLSRMAETPAGSAETSSPEGQEQDRILRRAIATLPAAYRDALTLFYLEERSYREMSERTGAGIPALKMRVKRGTEMLRAALGRRAPESIAA